MLFLQLGRAQVEKKDMLKAEWNKTRSSVAV